MPRSEDRLAARRPVRSRRRSPCGSPSTVTKARNLAVPCRLVAGRKRGVAAEGLDRSVRKHGYDSDVDFVAGAGKLDRTLENVESLVDGSGPTTGSDASTTSHSRRRIAWCSRTSPSRS